MLPKIKPILNIKSTVLKHLKKNPKTTLKQSQFQCYKLNFVGWQRNKIFKKLLILALEVNSTASIDCNFLIS